MCSGGPGKLHACGAQVVARQPAWGPAAAQLQGNWGKGVCPVTVCPNLGSEEGMSGSAWWAGGNIQKNLGSVEVFPKDTLHNWGMVLSRHRYGGKGSMGRCSSVWTTPTGWAAKGLEPGEYNKGTAVVPAAMGTNAGRVGCSEGQQTSMNPKKAYSSPGGGSLPG